MDNIEDVVDSVLHDMEEKGQIERDVEDGEEVLSLTNKGEIRAKHLLHQKPNLQGFLCELYLKGNWNGDRDNLKPRIIDFAEEFSEKNGINFLRTLQENDDISIFGISPQIEISEENLQQYDP